MRESEVQLWCKSLVDALIVLEHVFDHVVGLMDRVPLRVLVWVLHPELQWCCLFGLLSDAAHLVFERVEHVA